MSPSAAPARASSRGTPRRFSWWSMYDSASGVDDVVERNDPLDLATDETELVVAEALDTGPVGLRAG